MRLCSHQLGINASKEYASCLDDIENYKNGMYDQATQDGCSLALRTSPTRPVSASPTPSSQDRPSYILVPDPLLTVLTFTLEVGRRYAAQCHREVTLLKEGKNLQVFRNPYVWGRGSIRTRLAVLGKALGPGPGEGLPGNLQCPSPTSLLCLSLSREALRICQCSGGCLGAAYSLLRACGVQEPSLLHVWVTACCHDPAK